MIAILSSIYLIFLCYLYIKKKEYGNTYMIFGGITFLAVASYCYIPNVNPNIQRLVMFLSFSSFIMNFGIMTGLISFMKSKKMKKSITFSVISSLFMIIIIFNIRGIMEYIYIPVLMYSMQRKINMMLKK